MSVYQQLHQFLKQSALDKRNAKRQTDAQGKPLWRKTRRSTLFWLLCALVRERTGCLVSLARALPEPAQVRDRNKRL